MPLRKVKLILPTNRDFLIFNSLLLGFMLSIASFSPKMIHFSLDRTDLKITLVLFLDTDEASAVFCFSVMLFHS